MRLAVLVRAAAVEYDQLLVVAASQLRLEPLFGAALVLRFRHLESFFLLYKNALKHTFAQLKLLEFLF